MSLDRFKAALGVAEFLPHTLTLGSNPSLTAALPPAAASFVAGAWPGDSSAFELMMGEPWDRATLSEYRGLSEEDRMAVLAYVGFLNHEQVHRVDLLATPFGVSFQAKTCLETIGLLLEGAELIAALERTDCWRPLRDIPPVAENLVVTEEMEMVNARIRWFDALRGAAPTFVTKGWGGSTDVYRLGGVSLDLVEVHGLLPTVFVPGGAGAYLRPLTLLESRATALTGLMLMNRLGGDGFAATEVARLLQTLYKPKESFPDYRFLLDLFLRLAGESDLLAVAREEGASGLAGILRLIAVVGWYGLHATPETLVDFPFAISPMLRVLFGVQELIERASADQPRATDGVTFLEEIDAGDMGRKLGLRDVRETLSYSLRYLKVARHHNDAINPNPPLCEHFERTLSLQQAVIEERLEDGYLFFPGLPEDGCVLRTLAGSEAREGLILDPKPTPDETSEWFRLREMLLFRQARPPGFWSDLWTMIGAHPGAQEVDQQEARERALRRARFVHGGVWPTNAEILPWAPEILCVGMRRSALPKVFAKPDDLDLTTEWGVLGCGGGEALLALDISFPGQGEKVRLLFSGRRHRAMVDQILAAGKVAIASADAFEALGLGEWHPEFLVCPVEASSHPVAVAHAGEAFEEKLQRRGSGWLLELRADGAAVEWVIEAFGWRLPEEAQLFLAWEMAHRVQHRPMFVRGPRRPDLAEVLVAIGEAEVVQKFADGHIEGTGAKPCPLSAEEARSAWDEAAERLRESVVATNGLRVASLRPIDVRLD